MTTTDDRASIPATFADYMREHDLAADHPTLDNHRALWKLERRVEDEQPTVIPSCPSWCTLAAGHGYPSYDGGLDSESIVYQRQHVAFEGEHVTVDATEHNTSGFMHLEPAAGYLYGEKDELTAEQFRAVSAELLKAAEVLERIGQ